MQHDANGYGKGRNMGIKVYYIYCLELKQHWHCNYYSSEIYKDFLFYK